jgi:hypothetical protein
MSPGQQLSVARVKLLVLGARLRACEDKVADLVRRNGGDPAGECLFCRYKVVPGELYCSVGCRDAAARGDDPEAVIGGDDGTEKDM